MKPHVFHPEASAEYAAAVEYYAAVRPELGAIFYDEIQKLIDEVRRHPDRFFRFNPPARRALAHRFPYSVIYLDQPDRVWILALMHAKRRPGYWLSRTN